jgi:hypothetical protein
MRYWDSYKVFNPVSFNAGQWMDLIRRASTQFFTFTTRHHDGFSMGTRFSPGRPAFVPVMMSWCSRFPPAAAGVVADLAELVFDRSDQRFLRLPEHLSGTPSERNKAIRHIVPLCAGSIRKQRNAPASTAANLPV